MSAAAGAAAAGAAAAAAARGEAGVGGAPKVSEARERLVRVASELFYREGIHRVGMDRVLVAASVTRATMYRHFTGKEALVGAYLDREDAMIRDRFATVAEAPASEAIDLVIDTIADDIVSRHTRGCPFINAAAEYPDADSPVRRIVARHRAWFRGLVRELLARGGSPSPDEAAAALVMLRDAALVGAYLDGTEVARPAFVAEARRAALL